MKQGREGPSGDGAGNQDRNGLDRHGIEPSSEVHWDLSPAGLYGTALARQEGELTEDGAFTARTAPHTGRSPLDRYIVRDATTADTVDWGPVNAALPADAFQRLREDVIDHLASRELFVKNARAGAEGEAGIRVRVITTSAWHALFAHNMFIRGNRSGAPVPHPDFTVLHAPGMQADPARHATLSLIHI